MTDMAGPPRPLPDRVRAKRGIVVGGVFSLLVAFELLLGMGCAFAVSVIHIAGPVQAQARSCVAEVSGHHAVVETATGGYRSGDGAWGLDGVADVEPDMVLWYPGG